MSNTRKMVSTTDSIDHDPLIVYEELRLEGKEPNIATFCEEHPDHPSLAARLHALYHLRGDLKRLFTETTDTTPPPIIAPVGFRLMQKLGEGGMAYVYLAEQASPRRLCALKFIKQPNEDAHQRFIREANLTAHLNHPSIATVYSFGRENDLAFLATEYIHGFSLRAFLQIADLVAPNAGSNWIADALRGLNEDLVNPTTRSSYPGPVATMLTLSHQIALALGYAHDQRVIHRDIKPSNIVITVNGVAKLIDFGLAIYGHDLSHRVTQTGTFVGSFDYAAPEQLRGNLDEIGPWTDTYALGATLFEMLTLRTPFESPGYIERLEQCDAYPPRGPRFFNSQVPPRLDSVVMKALSPRQQHRFQDGVEMADALSHCSQQSGHGSYFFLKRYWYGNRPDLKSSMLIFLSLLVMIFAFLYLHERSYNQAMQTDQLRQEKRLAEDVLNLRLLDAKEKLRNCLPEEKPPLSSVSPPNKLKPPPHFWATLSVHQGKVRNVNPKAWFGLTEQTQSCLIQVIKALDLPGIAFQEKPIDLVIDLRIQSNF